MCFTIIGLGSFASWTSPALPYLINKQSEFPVSEIDGSWLSSIFSIGGIVGCWIVPPLLDRWGRKKTALVLAVPQIISWLILILAKNVTLLYISRIIGATSYIAANGVILAYIAEISDKDFRGTLLTYINVSFDVGVLFVVTVGALVSYSNLNLIMLSTPILFILTFIFMPESPYFYVICNEDNKARDSLIKLRRNINEETILLELKEIRDDIDKISCAENKLKVVFCNKVNRRAMIIVLVAFFAKHYSGYLTILAYTQDIFTYSGFSLKPELSSIVVACIKVLSGLLGVKIVDKLGRRILMLYTGIFASLSLGIIATFFLLKFYLKMENLSYISWLPLFALILYQVVCSFGIASIPNILMGELFPSEIKGMAMCCAFVIIDIYTFPVTLGFQPLNSVLGVYSTFYMFSVCCLIGTIIVYKIAPETKGKSLQEIQNLLLH